MNVINMCLGMFLFGFILYGTLWASWTWVAIFLSHVRELLDYYLLRYFFILFSFVFFWYPSSSNVGAFNVVLEVSETVFFSFHLVFFILLCFSYLHYSVSQMTYSFIHLLILLPHLFCFCEGFLVEWTSSCVLVLWAGYSLSEGQCCFHCCVLGYLWAWYVCGKPIC